MGLVAISPLGKAPWSLGAQLEAHSLGSVGIKATSLTGEQPKGWVRPWLGRDVAELAEEGHL